MSTLNAVSMLAFGIKHVEINCSLDHFKLWEAPLSNTNGYVEILVPVLSIIMWIIWLYKRCDRRHLRPRYKITNNGQLGISWLFIVLKIRNIWHIILTIFDHWQNISNISNIDTNIIGVYIYLIPCLKIWTTFAVCWYQSIFKTLAKIQDLL